MDRDDLSNIASIWIVGWDPSHVVTALRDRRINMSTQRREYFVINYDEKIVTASLRLSSLSCHPGEELDEEMEVLRDFLAA